MFPASVETGDSSPRLFFGIIRIIAQLTLCRISEYALTSVEVSYCSTVPEAFDVVVQVRNYLQLVRASFLKRG